MSPKKEKHIMRALIINTINEYANYANQVKNTPWEPPIQYPNIDDMTDKELLNTLIQLIQYVSIKN